MKDLVTSEQFSADITSHSTKSLAKTGLGGKNSTSAVNLNSIYKKIFKMNKSQNDRKKMLKPEEFAREQKQKYRQDYGMASMRRTSQKDVEQSAYYLCGGVSIETSCNREATGGNRSALNDFVQVLGAEVFEEKGLVEVKLQNTQKGLTNFKFLSNIMGASKSIEQQRFGADIDQYYTFVQNLLRKKRACEEVEGFSKFSEIVSNKFDGFDHFLADKLTQVQNKHRIFSYRVYQFDLFDFEFKMKSYGYSEDFLKTLGYSSLGQFRDLVMHQGIPEVFTLQTRQDISRAHMLQIAQRKRQFSEIACKLISLDGIEFDTQLDMELLPFYDSQTPIYNSLFDCSAVIEISTYNISNDTLRQVINMRRSINFDFSDAIKQDIYYELESQLFVDTFYSNSPLKIKKNYTPHSNHNTPIPLVKQQSISESLTNIDNHTDDTDHSHSHSNTLDKQLAHPKQCHYRYL